MKPNQTTLTKEEFITRSMAGDKFEHDGDIYDYDSERCPPFRFNGGALKDFWSHMDGKTIFTIVTPKKTIVLEEWLVKSFDCGHYTFEATGDYIESLGVNKIQKLSERTIEVDA